MISFKTSRQEDEYKKLQSKNIYLYNLIQDVAKYIQDNFKKTLVITMVDRTNAEQAEIYKDDPKYKTKPFKSPHQFAQAVDIRSKIFTADEIKKIENYINNKYNSTNFWSWTAKDHTVGTGAEHFHIQFILK